MPSSSDSDDSPDKPTHDVAPQLDLHTQFHLPGISAPSVVQFQVRQGPLPQASEFAEYKAIHEPAAQWILDEAAKNSDHSRRMTEIAARSAASDARLRRWLPFLVVAMFLAASVAIAVFANVALGSVGIGITMLSVITAYFKQP